MNWIHQLIQLQQIDTDFCLESAIFTLNDHFFKKHGFKSHHKPVLHKILRSYTFNH